MTASQRATKAQAARIAAGLCRQCGGKRGRSKRYCDPCLVKERILNRARNGFSPKRIGGPGRPAITEKP